MLIATYNVNSINARLENLTAWLKTEQPDVVLLQEIKTEFNSFPFFELQTLGYEAKIIGQKSYNGVTILSRRKLQNVVEGLPNLHDEQARYIEADIEVDNVMYRVASIYLPNGNPPYNNPDDDSRYDYKLKWMDALYVRAQQLLQLRRPVILGGDFNAILTDFDVYDPELFKHNALFREEVKQRMYALQYLGYYDVFRQLHPDNNGYTYWDYAGAALVNDLGMRIDYLLMSPDAVDRLQSVEVDKTPRQADKPSDHTVLKAILK